MKEMSLVDQSDVSMGDGLFTQVVIGVAINAIYDGVKAVTSASINYICSFPITEQYGDRPQYTDASSALARNGHDAQSDTAAANRGFGTPGCDLGGMLKIQDPTSNG